MKRHSYRLTISCANARYGASMCSTILRTPCSARVRMPWFPSSGNVRQEDMTYPWRGRTKHFVKCASKVMLHCRMNWRRCFYWISSSADQLNGAPESGARGEHRQSLPRRAVPRLARRGPISVGCWPRQTWPAQCSPVCLSALGSLGVCVTNGRIEQITGPCPEPLGTSSDRCPAQVDGSQSD